MNHFKNAIILCGLSSNDAAQFLGLSKSAVESMASGRRHVSNTTWRKISDLWACIQDSSAKINSSMSAATDEVLDPRIHQWPTSANMDGSPDASNSVASTIAVLAAIHALPPENDGEDTSDSGRLLMPVADIRLPDVGGRIGRILLRGRWYEQEMLDYIRSLNITGNYLDVGANIGNHSVYFATNTNADRVFSFEPTKKARAALNKFVELNSLWTKISTIPYACSDFTGEIEVVESIASAATPQKYQCRKIDDLISVPVSLIKMDIEGAEPYALRGAVKILEANKPVMFIEVHDEHHMKEIMGIIGPIGYKTTGKVWNPSPTYEFVAS